MSCAVLDRTSVNAVKLIRFFKIDLYFKPKLVLKLTHIHLLKIQLLSDRMTDIFNVSF